MEGSMIYAKTLCMSTKNRFVDVVDLLRYTPSKWDPLINRTLTISANIFLSK